MKKIIIMLLALLPTLLMAKGDDTKYLAGAVPEKDGIVVFEKSFKVPGQSQADIYQVIKSYIASLVDNSIEGPTPYARFNMDTPDTIVARCCEWIVFKKKPLYLDRTRFRYQVNAFISGNNVKMQVTKITYYYEEDNEGNNGRTIRAEEWISDREALNKARTKLVPISAKFRRNTVDRTEAIFEGAMDAFEPKQAPAAEVKKVRKGVVEE